MDDLVVIILTLIIAVVGVIGQSKRKKQAAAQGNTQKKEGDFWELLNEDPFQLIKPKTENVVEEVVEEAEPYENEQDYEFYANREGGRFITEEPKVETPQETSPVQKQKKNFSLRKAVIYNEILNRKYI
jgi:hypothetical protein